MIKKSWKKMWTDHFRMKYSETVERWTDCRSDDRLIFCNVYRIIMRALDSLPEDPDLFVKSAMSTKLQEEQKVMDSIMTVFEGR